MSEDEKQESQKTVVAFIAGLLIGGLLVWVFGGAPQSDTSTEDADETATSETTDTPTETTDGDNDGATSTTEDDASDTALPELPVGDADVAIDAQPAGTTVVLEGATFPSDEGWIGVRGYVDGQLTNLLGVARYSKEQGLVPEQIVLLAPTVAGNTYAIVYYSESGDRVFNVADDVQIGGIAGTFTAQ